MSTNACTIEQVEISHVLLDSEASISLLPFSVYQQLGLDDLSPTRVTIQQADRSVKVPKGKINDVLIWVGEFIYPVDFIAFETQGVFNPLPLSLDAHSLLLPILLSTIGMGP